MSEPEPEPHSDPIRPSGLPYLRQSPTTRDDLPDKGPGAPAAWGLRAGARILDYVLVGFVAVTLAAQFGVGTTDSGRLTGPVWPRFLFPVMFMLYETLLIGRVGQTCGKFLFRVRAVDWDGGGLASYRQAAIRAVVPGVFAFVAAIGGVLGYLQFVPIIIYLSSLADVIYRGWHDKAAGTIVLSAPWRMQGSSA